MNDALKVPAKFETSYGFGFTDLFPGHGRCSKKSDGAVEGFALSPLPTNSEDKRVCSLYRPNFTLAKPSQGPVCTVEGAKAEQSAALVQQAQEAERKAGRQRDTASRLAYYEHALMSYQMAEDVDGAKRVLGSILSCYENAGNVFGVEKTKAEIAFVDGNFEKALLGFRTVEKFLLKSEADPSGNDREAALVEVNFKISATLQVAAAQNHIRAVALNEQAVKNHDEELAVDAVRYYREAITLMKEAVWRTPSEALTAGTLGLIVEAKDAARKAVVELELDIALLKGKGGKCNTNCHRDDSKRFVSDLEVPSSRDEGERLALLYKEGQLASLKSESVALTEEIPAVVESGFGIIENIDGQIRKTKILAEAYVSAGEFERAQKCYEGLILALDNLQKAENDPVEIKALVLKRAEAKHQLAAICLHEYELIMDVRQVSAEPLLQKASALLDETYRELTSLDPIISDDKEATLALRRAREFLTVQSGLMRVEIRMSSAKSLDDVRVVKNMLLDLDFRERSYLANVEKLEPGDPLRQAFGRAQLKLAQVYYIDDDKSGDAQVAMILETRKGDEFLCSQALLTKGMDRLSTKGKALEGIHVLRRIQLEFPGSDADNIVRSSPKIAHLRAENGILREDVDEGDFGEALKAAIDAAVNTPPERRLGLMVLGGIIGFLCGGPAGAVVGAGIGAGTDSVWGIVEKRSDILVAYDTGISNVSLRETGRNLFMLALDVAFWIPAGAVGKLAASATKAGLSYGAKLGARILPRFEMPFLAKQIVGYAGRGIMIGAPFVASTQAALIFHKAERSLFLGEDFHVNKKEALLMLFACGSFAMAHYSGVGSRFAARSTFAKGKTAPVVHNGQVIGQANWAGRVSGWSIDTFLGANGFYATLWGIDLVNGTNEAPAGYGRFMAEQFMTLGPMHAGSQWASKTKPIRALDAVALKFDKRASQWLIEAREEAKNSGGNGPWNGFEPALAGVSGQVPFRFVDAGKPAVRPAPMAMIGTDAGTNPDGAAHAAVGRNRGKMSSERRKSLKEEQEELAARQALADPVEAEIIKSEAPSERPKTADEIAREAAVRKFETSYEGELKSNPKLAGKSNIFKGRDGVEIDAADTATAGVALIGSRRLLRGLGYRVDLLPANGMGELVLKATDPAKKVAFEVRISVQPEMFQVNKAPAIKQVLDPLAEIGLKDKDIIELDWRSGRVVVRNESIRDKVVSTIQARHAGGFTVGTGMDGSTAVMRVTGRAGFAQGLGFNVDFTIRIEVAGEAP